MKRGSSVTRLLEELIAIPSINPGFLEPHHPHGGERLAADFILAKAAQAGLDVEQQMAARDRYNVLCVLSPKGRVKQRILLAPHLDTVGDCGMGEAMFKPVRREGRIYGRGSCDTKGSVAAMLTAVMELGKKRRLAQTEVIFCGLIDEENEQLGSRYYAQHGPKPDLAIVGEPTRLRVVTAHKGDVWLEVETRGRTAHGSTPHLGVNAIHAMAGVIDALETDYRDNLNGRRHPLLGSGSVNVGWVEGGIQPNVVPDRCRIRLDRRTLPGETDAQVLREIRALLRRLRVRGEVCNLKEFSCPPMETSAVDPLVKGLMRAAGQRKPLGVDFFCDAAILAAQGTACVALGPGDIAQAHTAAEWVAVSDLEDGVELLQRFIRAIDAA